MESQDITYYIDVLISTIPYVGFFGGMFHVLVSNIVSTLKTPLISIVSGIIGGGLYQCVVYIVALLMVNLNFIPNKCEVIIPILVILSAIYSLICGVTRLFYVPKKTPTKPSIDIAKLIEIGVKAALQNQNNASSVQSVDNEKIDETNDEKIDEKIEEKFEEKVVIIDTISPIVYPRNS